MIRRKVLATGILPSSASWAVGELGPREGSPPVDIKSVEDLVIATRHNNNTGNYLIGDGAMKALSGCDVVFVPAWQLMELVRSRSGLESIRNNFDFLVIITANLLRPDYSPDVELALVESIGLPATFMSIGIQNFKALNDLPPVTHRLIDVLKDRDDAVFCRGSETASFFGDRGLRRVFATGCPSLFAYPERMCESFYRFNQLGEFPLQSSVTAGYLGGDKGAVADINAHGLFSERIAYVMQDEFLYYGLQISRSNADLYNAGTGQVSGDFSYKFKEFQKHGTTLHLFFETERWREWISDFSLYLGRRFHGGVIAMQAGVPAIFSVIDDRMKEMLAFAGFPNFDAQALQDARDRKKFLEGFIRSIEPSTLVTQYGALERNFRSSLYEVGLCV